MLLDLNKVVAPSPSSGKTTRWWVLVASPVAADLGIQFPGTSWDVVAHAREMGSSNISGSKLAFGYC